MARRVRRFPLHDLFVKSHLKQLKLLDKCWQISPNFICIRVDAIQNRPDERKGEHFA